MPGLTRKDLYSLEEYAEKRTEFRAKVIAHKKTRRVAIGPNMTLHFEDCLTIKYQIQEILRVEKVFEAEGIDEELKAYNPLIPEGGNLKATMMIEFEDPAERAEALAGMIGIEDTVWVKVGEFGKVFAIADEDLERENEQKTSSVHFLRFELTTEMINAAKQNTAIGVGVDHAQYVYSSNPLPDSVRQSLVTDLK